MPFDFHDLRLGVMQFVFLILLLTLSAMFTEHVFQEPFCRPMYPGVNHPDTRLEYLTQTYDSVGPTF